MRALLLPLLLLAGCEDADRTRSDADSGTSNKDSGAAVDAAAEDMGVEDAGAELPSMLRVSGEAMEIAPDGERADCSFFADVGDLTFTADGGWTGTIFGGEVFRTITTSTAGNLYELSALIGGPASAEREGERLKVRIAGDQPADANPFWLALEVLTGTITAAHEAEGSWVCAPLDLNEPGFVDRNVYAPGSWRVRPSP
jgi:hypothetical protein